MKDAACSKYVKLVEEKDDYRNHISSCISDCSSTLLQQLE